MKVIFSKEKIVIILLKEFVDFDIKDKDALESKIKNYILKIKRKNIDIGGFYNINVYHNNNYGIIFEIFEDGELKFFPNIIDIKLNIYKDSLIYIKVDDFFLVKSFEKKYYLNNEYYVNINSVKEKTLLSEFYQIIYGDEAINLKNKLIEI